MSWKIVALNAVIHCIGYLSSSHIIGSHLELRDHSDFTEPFGGRVLRFLVSEDLVQQGVVRLLKQAGELWRHRIL